MHADGSIFMLIKTKDWERISPSISSTLVHNYISNYKPDELKIGIFGPTGKMIQNFMVQV